MTINNVGELKGFLKNCPNDMSVTGYDGSDNEPTVSIVLQDYKDIDTDPKPSPTVLIMIK